MSWTMRVYMNKKKLNKKISDVKIYNEANIFPQTEHVLQNYYESISNSQNLETHCIKSLYSIFLVLGSKVINYIDAIAGLMQLLLKQTANGYSFSSIQYIFECLSLVIETVSKDAGAQKKLLDSVLVQLNELMNKGSNDMTSFLLQIYALIIKNCTSLGGQEKKIIFESLLDQKNYQQDFVSLFPTYSLFFQEYVNHDASVVVNYSNALQNVCAKFLEFRIDNAFFSLLTKIFYAVDLNAFVNSSWFGFLINAGLSVISMTSANSDIASARPLFFKE